MIKDIEAETSFVFRNLIVGLIKSKAEFKTDQIFKQSESVNKDLNVFIDFIIAQEKESLTEIRKMFRQKYEISLSEFFKKNIQDPYFQKLLLKLLEEKRSQVEEVEKIEMDVERIYSSLKNEQTLKDTIVQVVSERSVLHLRYLSDSFQKKYKQDLVEMVKERTQGIFRTALLACFDDPFVYWSKRIRKEQKFDPKTAILCFSQSDKFFLENLKKEYKNSFGCSLEDEIRKETSGNLQHLFLTLLDFPQNEKEDY